MLDIACSPITEYGLALGLVALAHAVGVATIALHAFPGTSTMVRFRHSV